jgi:type IV pilus assembly protein PilE
MAVGRRLGGFTTIELLIAVVIAGVLVTIALPTFLDSIRKGRRSEAVSTLAQLQQAQERYRSSNPTYAGASLLTSSLRIAATTSSGYYDIAITAADGTGYTATATARSGTSQANDGDCKVLGVRMTSGNLAYGSGATSVDWADPKRCWAR